MKVAVYNREGNYRTLYEGIANPRLKGDLLIFDGGSFSGLANLILLNDNETPPPLLSDALALDKKPSLTVTKSLQEENEELKKRVNDLEDAVLFLMNMP